MQRMGIDVELAVRGVKFAWCFRFSLYLLYLTGRPDYSHLHRVVLMVGERVSRETTMGSSGELKEIFSPRPRSAVDFRVRVFQGNV
jgi:hypothetical protein